MSRCRQQVRNNLATSCNGICGKNTTQQTQQTFPVPTFCGLVTDLLRGSYGETGVVDFGWYWAQCNISVLGDTLAWCPSCAGDWRRRKLFEDGFSVSDVETHFRTRRKGCSGCITFAIYYGASKNCTFLADDRLLASLCCLGRCALWLNDTSYSKIVWIRVIRKCPHDDTAFNPLHRPHRLILLTPRTMFIFQLQNCSLAYCQKLWKLVDSRERYCNDKGISFCLFHRVLCCVILI